VSGAPAADAAAGADWRESSQVATVQKRAVRVLVLAQVVGGVGAGIAGATAPLLAQAVTGSASLAGIGRTAIAFGAAGTAIPLAAAASRFGRRRSLTLGWLTASAGGLALVLASTSRSVPVLIIGMLAFGAGTATALQNRYAAVDLAPARHRARDLSIVVWATTVGTVIGPNLGTPGAWLASAVGLPRLAGGFLIGAASAVAAASVSWAWLRPDPLLLVREHARWPQEAGGSVPRASGAAAGPASAVAQPAVVRRTRVREVAALVASSKPALFGMTAVVVAQAVMTAVMTMSPVFMNGDGATLTVVGISVSLHIAGMYALSPLVGRLADRVGQLQVIIIAQLLFIAAAVFGALPGRSLLVAAVGLVLLGVAWSFAFVAGSAVIAGAFTDPADRTAVQGTTDMLMNLVAAFAAALAGPVMTGTGYGGLNILAAVPALPVLAWALRRIRPRLAPVPDAPGTPTE
jgi:MFS family permease